MTKKTKKYSWIDEIRVYRRLLKYARPYIWRLIVGTLFALLYGGANTGLLIQGRSALSKMFGSDLLDSVFIAGVMMVAIALFRSIGSFVSDYLLQWVGNKVVFDLRMQAFAHIQQLSMRFFSASRTGELISRIINDAMMIERAVSVVVCDLAKEPFALIGAVFVVFYLDARLAFIALILFPVCVVPIALFGRKVRRNARNVQERLADLVSILQENIAGIRIVKAFGTEKRELSRFFQQSNNFFLRTMKVARDKAAIEPVIVVIAIMGLVLVMTYASYRKMPPQDIIIFAAAMMLMYEPVKKLSKLHLSVQQTSAAAERIFEILDTPPVIIDKPDAIELKPPIESIVFENVSFAYDNEQILKNINLQIKAGSRIAIVGSSGAGKTTLVSLLPRFFDVSSGCIKFNGIDIRNYTIASLRRHIGIVTQETFLFNDTVAANIAYGTENASFEEIEAAAKKANAHEFINDLPEGYNTIIGERGTRLSGGQCQRIAIARAILRDPPVLILDEATSALDTESERLVQAAIDQAMQGRTVFAIAHRISTIIHCDSIIVLDKGSIVEQGSHEELLKANGIYRRLYDLQFQA